MGLFDSLKKATLGEVERHFIARPDPARNLLVYRWPDSNIRRMTQLTVGPDEVAVFVREGKVMGTLPPGRHTLDGASIPFLSVLIDAATGGNLFVSEIYFVSTRQIHGVKFGGELGRVKDPDTELRVRLRAFGECTIQVSDPTALLTQQTGLGALQEDLSQFKRVIGERILLALSDDVGELVAGKRTSLDVVLSGSLKEELLEGCKTGVDQNLHGIGLSVVTFQNLNVNPDEADWAQLQKDAEELRAAAREARKQQLINQVEIERRAQLSNMAGGYQNFAVGEQMIGAGQGMAKGGESAGTALSGAGLGIGLGMASQLVQNAGMQPPPPGWQAPPVAGPSTSIPPLSPAGASAVTCPSCRATVAPGKFCASCGAALAASPGKCAGCGAELSPGAKFCSGCGKPAGA